MHLYLFIFSFRTVALLLNITYVCCPYICLLPRSGIQRRRPVLIIEFQQRPQSLIEMDSRLLPSCSPSPSLSHLCLSLSLTLLLCTCVLRIWSIRSISLRHMQSTRSVRFQLPGKRFASAACTPRCMERKARQWGGARVDRCLACWFNLLAPNAAGPSTRLAIGKLSLCSAGQASAARMTTGNTGPLILGYMCSPRLGVLRVGVAVSTKDCARKWGIKTECVCAALGGSHKETGNFYGSLELRM